ncbi:hypothetical protein Trydic_g2680 [Trypoxylus dichotomus]
MSSHKQFVLDATEVSISTYVCDAEKSFSRGRNPTTNSHISKISVSESLFRAAYRGRYSVDVGGFHASACPPQTVAVVSVAFLLPITSASCMLHTFGPHSTPALIRTNGSRPLV